MTSLKNKKILWAAGVAAVLAAGFLYRRHLDAPKAASPSPEEPRVPAVAAYRIRPRPVSGQLHRNGTIRAHAETLLQFGASGRVIRFDVEKGQFVKKGSLIAALDPAEAKNSLQAAELEFQKASWKHFRDRTIDKLEYEKSKLHYNQARLEFEKTEIRAPHAGYLVEKWARAGEHVEPGTAVGKLMDKSRVYIEMSLTEDDIRQLRTGQIVEVTVDALPGYRADGRVQSITPYLQGQSRSFHVKVSLPENPREALNPGMFARCAVHQYRNDRALTVPREAAVEMDDAHANVYTVDAGNVVRARKVPVLFRDEEDVEVGGMAEGDVVILRPPPTLSDGARVSVSSLFDPGAETAAVPSVDKGP
jgi:membrane fusion protein, multidrug efflux system